MSVHIYRPILFGFKWRKFNFYDLNGKKLSFLTEDSEIVLKDAPHQIKVKVDWFSGKTKKLEGDEVYLIVYFEFGGFLEWFNPADCKKYFRFKEVSKAEYLKAIKTKGESLKLSKTVTKTASLTSRFLSFFMLLFVAVLFYYTDYSEINIQSDELDFIRFLALITGLGAIINLVTNFDKRSSPYPKVFFLVLLSVYTYWQFNSSHNIDATLFLLPALLAIVLSGFYSLGNTANS